MGTTDSSLKETEQPPILEERVQQPEVHMPAEIPVTIAAAAEEPQQPEPVHSMMLGGNVYIQQIHRVKSVFLQELDDAFLGELEGELRQAEANEWAKRWFRFQCAAYNTIFPRPKGRVSGLYNERHNARRMVNRCTIVLMEALGDAYYEYSVGEEDRHIGANARKRARTELSSIGSEASVRRLFGLIVSNKRLENDFLLFLFVGMLIDQDVNFPTLSTESLDEISNKSIHRRCFMSTHPDVKRYVKSVFRCEHRKIPGSPGQKELYVHPAKSIRSFDEFKLPGEL